ncbi:DUF4238 domain-containing protein [Ferrovibrio sp.]|uniref:DUF4238 domain-containing protein n=1 Tax=Ferrovibrio sp. TaxID=1917215 RepID=UPI003D0D81A4
MPRDHYISQVHLKNFYSPALVRRMYAIRKSDLLKFQCKSEDVCRIEGGSTNLYLDNNRVIEEYLKFIEPKYNTAIESLREGCPNRDAIHVVAGFIAYIMTCSPTGMRLHINPLKKQLETTLIRLAESDRLPSLPSAFEGKSIRELLDGNVLRFDVDEKYPQAIGIMNIIKIVSMFGNFSWEVLINNLEDSPFFTSDFPIASEASGDSDIINRIVPLAPNLAVRIIPNLKIEKKNVDLKFSNFRYKVKKVESDEIIKINKLIVRSAENTIFYSCDFPWIEKFIAKNRFYKLEAITQTIPVYEGGLLLTRQRIVKTN